EPLRYTAPISRTSRSDFQDAVLKAKDYIKSGDVFQVVLSRRFDFKLDGSLIDFYRILRSINPSPYMYFLKMGERQIVGSSPEMLVRVEQGLLETYPIAGTRPRTDDQAENQTLAEELLSDPKERAEHVMLVDLARNDIGKLAEFGSVHTPEFMTVHQYSHVQHIVSRVVGKMRPDIDC
ncbi:anthranilate synthase component I family protein, partial [Candidatus Bathyarchaeota archaeon]|nr:anthranilate synthase component I family protein [Candidatus Bathyarchaeota archaeon]